MSIHQSGVEVLDRDALSNDLPLPLYLQLARYLRGQIVSGRFGHLPIVEALFLGGLWGVVALGALLFAVALWTGRDRLLGWAVWAWVIGGTVFLLFGAMNFYTHIGMYYNIAHGTSYKW